ncbi:MAG TPA: hypothetical protein VJY33_21160 [Isosphaeraceae bacterium]|nr:hypothetical protein [Isosphaeraceae bacterium]
MSTTAGDQSLVSSRTQQWDKLRKDDCPVCSRSGWCREKRTSDGRRLIECMHTHDSTRPGFMKTKQNRDGQECSYYWVDGAAIGVKPSPNGKPKTVERASPKTCHAAYLALSEVLGLNAQHHAALIARGLGDEAVTAGRFATLPGDRRGELALAVLKLVKNQGITPEDLLRVPGFFRRGDGMMALAGRSGLLIPVTGADGMVLGMVIRPDHPALDPAGKVLGKYQWFTSSGRGGAAAVAMAHVPPVAGRGPHEVVRLTEGALKAAVAQHKTGMPTIGLPGVGT